MCGDDLIIPSVEFNDPDSSVAALAFLNRFKPPGLEDYTFVYAAGDDDEGVNCWTAPVFRSGASSSKLAGTHG